jgi:hypothetical protein
MEKFQEILWMKNILMPSYLFQQIEVIIRAHSLDGMEEAHTTLSPGGIFSNTALLICDLASLGTYPGSVKNRIIEALESNRN